jgi:hypothetical protein
MTKYAYILCVLFFLIIIRISAQTFDVEKFSHPAKYGWDSAESQQAFRNDLQNRQKLLQLYEMNKFNYRERIIKSAFVPGWTQFSAGKYARGQIILGLEVALFVSSFYYYDQAMNYYDKYKSADYIGDIEDYYEKSKTPWRNSQLFFGLGVLVWIYNLYDTYLVVDEYNTELWQKIYLDYYNKKITVTASGITYRF